jgi:hypothetical protein
MCVLIPLVYIRKLDDSIHIYSVVVEYIYSCVLYYYAMYVLYYYAIYVLYYYAMSVYTPLIRCI